MPLNHRNEKVKSNSLRNAIFIIIAALKWTIKRLFNSFNVISTRRNFRTCNTIIIFHLRTSETNWSRASITKISRLTSLLRPPPWTVWKMLSSMQKPLKQSFTIMPAYNTEHYTINVRTFQPNMLHVPLVEVFPTAQKNDRPNTQCGEKYAIFVNYLTI